MLLLASASPLSSFADYAEPKLRRAVLTNTHRTGLEYQLERECFWNATAGYGPSQMYPSPADPATGGKARTDGIVGGSSRR